MSKFTPGSWVFDTKRGYLMSIVDKPIITETLTAQEVSGSQFVMIGHLYDWTNDEYAENGKLIMLAPFLYNIVKALADLPDEQCMISPLVNRAKSIIAAMDSTEYVSMEEEEKS